MEGWESVSVSVPEQITQKIIDVLKADSELSGLSYYFGPPLTRQTPFVYVKWVGGPIVQETLKGVVWRHKWEVVVVDSSRQDDVAEKSVMAKAERIYTVLKTNPTLDGLVRDANPTELTAETVVVALEWAKPELILAAARLVLEVTREWSA